MQKPRITDEWLIGATLGGYIILTIVGNSWGYAFVHAWCTDFSTTPHSSDLSFLEFPLTGLLLAIAGWVQSKCSQVQSGLLNRRHARLALWMNLLGILGLLVGLASNYGPGERDWFLTLIALTGFVFWPVGILLSLINLASAGIRQMRAPRAVPPVSQNHQ